MKSTMIHSGQYKPYGDYVMEWDIETGESDTNEVIEYCFNNLSKRKLPEKSEFMTNIRFGSGKMSGDADYYFAGYYTLVKTEKGYKFSTYEPYAD